MDLEPKDRLRSRGAAAWELAASGTRWRGVTFATPEDAQKFIALLLCSGSGDPLLILSCDGLHDVSVSGTWEDHQGLAVVIIADNHLVWSRTHALALAVREGAVTLTLDGDPLWEVRRDRNGIAIEGLFFSRQGMVVLTPWGYLEWSDEDATRLLDAWAPPSAETFEAAVRTLPPGPLRPVH